MLVSNFFTALGRVFSTFNGCVAIPVVVCMVYHVFGAPHGHTFRSTILININLVNVSFIAATFNNILAPLVAHVISTSNLSGPTLSVN